MCRMEVASCLMESYWSTLSFRVKLHPEQLTNHYKLKIASAHNNVLVVYNVCVE